MFPFDSPIFITHTGLWISGQNHLIPPGPVLDMSCGTSGSQWMDVAGHGPGIVGTVTSTPPSGTSFRVSLQCQCPQDRTASLSEQRLGNLYFHPLTETCGTHPPCPADNFTHSQAPPALVMKRRPGGVSGRSITVGPFPNTSQY